MKLPKIRRGNTRKTLIQNGCYTRWLFTRKMSIFSPPPQLFTSRSWYAKHVGIKWVTFFMSSCLTRRNFHWSRLFFSFFLYRLKGKKAYSRHESHETLRTRRWLGNHKSGFVTQPTIGGSVKGQFRLFDSSIFFYHRRLKLLYHIDWCAFSQSPAGKFNHCEGFTGG